MMLAATLEPTQGAAAAAVAIYDHMRHTPLLNLRVEMVSVSVQEGKFSLPLI